MDDPVQIMGRYEWLMVPILLEDFKFQRLIFAPSGENQIIYPREYIRCAILLICLICRLLPD